MNILRNLTAMAVVAAALTIAAQARADVIDFYLNQPECTGSCSSAPALIPNLSAVEVIVTTTTGSAGDYVGATIKFVAPSSNIDTPAWINVNDEGNTSNFSATVSIPGGVTGVGSEDHFGTMTTGTGASEAPTVTFTLTALDGFSWLDAADVLTPTTNYAAAYGNGFEAVTAAQDAGYYTPTSVPEPASVALLGTALVRFGAIRRRRRRNLS